MRGVIDEEVGQVTPSEEKSIFARSLEGAISKAIQRIEKSYPDSLADSITSNMIQRANQQNHKQTVDSINQAIGIDVSAAIQSTPKVRDEIEAATIQNVNLIKSVKAEYLDDVRKAVVNAAVNGERHESIVRVIAKVGHVSESRAKLIARDQTNKLNGALTQARQTSLGIDEYVWSTSGDERVRQSHRDLDGKTFKWNDPPPEGHPAQSINCRCIATPVIKFD